MSSGDRLPVRNSLTDHKRERSPTPAKSRTSSPPRDPRSGGAAAAATATATTAKEQDQRSLSPQGPRAGPSIQVPATEQRPPGTMSSEPRPRSSLPWAPKPTPPQNIPARKRSPLKTRSREQGQRAAPSRDGRAGDASTLQEHSPSTSSRERMQSRRGVSAETEAYAQTHQMAKATRELRKLNEMFEGYSSSRVGSEEYDPKARQMRPGVQVVEHVVDDFERELMYAIRQVRSNSQLPHELRSGAPYNAEINEVMQREPDVKARYQIFQRMLKALRRPSGGAGPKDDMRTDRIRQLKLVIQDVEIELAQFQLQQETLHSQQEVTSPRTDGVGSRIASNTPDTRARKKTRVINVRPLQTYPLQTYR